MSRTSGSPRGPRVGVPVEIAEKLSEPSGPSKLIVQVGLIATGVIACIAALVFLPDLLAWRPAPAQSVTTAGVRQPAPSTAVPPYGHLMMRTTQAYNRVNFDFSAPEKSNRMSDIGYRIRENCLPPATRGAEALSLNSDTWTQTDVRKNDPHPWLIRVDYERATRFLACAIATEPQRFCNPHYKAQLIQHLRDYDTLFGSVVSFAQEGAEMLAQYRASPGTSSAIAMMERIDDLGQGRNPGDIASGSGRREPKVPEFDQSLAENLRDAARAGYVSKRDFGYFDSATPASIAPYLVAVKKPRCQ